MHAKRAPPNSCAVLNPLPSSRQRFARVRHTATFLSRNAVSLLRARRQTPSVRLFDRDYLR